MASELKALHIVIRGRVLYAHGQSLELQECKILFASFSSVYMCLCLRFTTSEMELGAENLQVRVMLHCP